VSETTYRIRKSKDGQFYWVQVAANGEVLATSEMYTKLQHALDGAYAAGAEGTLEYEGTESDRQALASNDAQTTDDPEDVVDSGEQGTVG
jgi:uncharacterized protein YegP (UPF0339 family)